MRELSPAETERPMLTQVMLTQVMSKHVSQSNLPRGNEIPPLPYLTGERGYAPDKKATPSPVRAVVEVVISFTLFFGVYKGVLRSGLSAWPLFIFVPMGIYMIFHSTQVIVGWFKQRQENASE